MTHPQERFRENQQKNTSRNLGVLCGGLTYSTTAKMARTQINIPISNILFWIGNNFSMEYILSSNWENIEHTNSPVD
jgi:hypothetical protein